MGELSLLFFPPPDSHHSTTSERINTKNVIRKRKKVFPHSFGGKLREILLLDQVGWEVGLGVRYVVGLKYDFRKYHQINSISK